MLSRVAETIYWLGRYLERAENTVRIIQVNTNLVLDLPKGMTLGWHPLVTILGADELYESKHEEYTERRVLHFLVGDMDNDCSIMSSLAAARENARTIRDIIPRQAWEEINELHGWALEHQREGVHRKDRHNYLAGVTRRLQTLTGLLAGVMSHDAAYAFLHIGRKLERADMTTRIIDVRYDSLLAESDSDIKPFEDYSWMSLLRSMSAYQMYRRSMQTRVRRVEVLRFLFRDPDFPRSLAYALDSLGQMLSEIPEREEPVRVLEELSVLVVETEVEKMDPQELHEFIDVLQLELSHLHTSVAKAYFLPQDQQQSQAA